MKQLCTLLWCFLCLVADAQRIEITNNSDLSRIETVIEIPWSSIISQNPNLTVGDFKVMDADIEVSFQVEYKGLTEVQNLLVQLSIAENEKRVLTIVTGKPMEFAAKTFARYVPERLDDFAWENDKIAFRAYGEALEDTKGDAYGFDVWGKRTSDLIINRRYQHGDYHNDRGDGLDYYHVGLTLGAGNISPIINDKIYYSGNYHRWKILDNGPLRTTFILEYDEWLVDGKKVTSEKKISIDAGSQMYKVEAFYHFQDESLPLAIGIVKRPEAGMITLNETHGLMSYWEPEHGKDGITGVGVFVPERVNKMTVTEEQLLTHVKTSKNTPFIYYAGAAWNKAGSITNADAWQNYLDHFRAEKLTSLQITVQ
jgi:hypothetical protein